MLELFGCTAKSEIRPEVTAGPIDLKLRLENVSELKLLDSVVEVDFFCACVEIQNNTEKLIIDSNFLFIANSLYKIKINEKLQ